MTSVPNMPICTRIWYVNLKYSKRAVHLLRHPDLTILLAPEIRGDQICNKMAIIWKNYIFGNKILQHKITAVIVHLFCYILIEESVLEERNWLFLQNSSNAFK